MPVTILLKALGYMPEQILSEFFAFDTFRLLKNEFEFELVPERLRGEIARFDFATKSGKLIVGKDKSISVKHVREMQETHLNKINVPQEFLLGRVLAQAVIDKESGEVIANANDELP